MNAKILFEREADDFDCVIPLLIPFYGEIYNILVDSVPFKSNSPIRILDIGCGTGTFAKILKESFPRAQITCLDFAENMIRIAKSKLSNYKNDVRFMIGDFNKLNLSQEYDVVVSSFALHHIKTDSEKINLYKNIYRALNKKGIFLTADIVLGSNNHINNLYDKKWKEYMAKHFPKIEVEKELLPKYQTGDNPSELFNHLKWMEHSGFVAVEAIWKYYNFAIFGGCKNL